MESTTWKSWLCLYLYSNKGFNSQKSTQLNWKKKKPSGKLWEQPPASSSFLRFRWTRGSSKHDFEMKAKCVLFYWFSMLHTKLEHETSRFYCHVFCCSCVRTIAPQTQNHMVSVCTANYLQRKEFQDYYEPFSDLIFIPMISFIVKLSLWHSSYVLRKNLLFFNVRT